jgi:hypothetical protein
MKGTEIRGLYALHRATGARAGLNGYWTSVYEIKITYAPSYSILDTFIAQRMRSAFLVTATWRAGGDLQQVRPEAVTQTAYVKWP